MSSAEREAEKLWMLWHPRMLMLLSSALHVALMVLGIFRKQSASPTLHFVTWLVYNVANGISYLTILFPFPYQSETDCRLVALWAAFCFLHSGGVDTLNAYSLEDNRLWKRYALLFVFKTVACVNTVAQCFSREQFMAVVVLIDAMYNYRERIWAHRRGSMDGLRESPQTCQELENSPRSDYPAIMDEKLRLERSGNLTTLLRVGKSSTVLSDSSFLTSLSTFFPSSIADDVKLLMRSNLMHHRYRRLYENGRFCSDDRKYNESIFGHMSYNEAFQIAEIEMCLMHDEIYSRAPALHRRWGLITGLFFLILMIGLASIFCVIVLQSNLPVADVYLTYLIFIFHFSVRVVSLFLHIFSYQNVIGIINYVVNRRSSECKWRKEVGMCLINLTLLLRPVKSSWLYMGQFDFWGCCFDHKPSSPFERFVQFIGLSRELENYCHTKYVPISEEVRKSIFEVLKYESTQAASRGQWPIDVGNCSQVDLRDRSLGQRLCIWITATNLCHASLGSEVSPVLKTAKQLSDYLLYFLKANPVLLSTIVPDSVNICNDTMEELRSFMHKKGPFAKNDRHKAAQLILKQVTDCDPRRVMGDQNRAEFWNGCIVAQQLQKLDMNDKEWILVRVLVDLLTHIALQCRGELHAQLLTKGLQPLTVVWWIAFLSGLSQYDKLESGATAIAVVVQQP